MMYMHGLYELPCQIGALVKPWRREERRNKSSWSQLRHSLKQYLLEHDVKHTIMLWNTSINNYCMNDYKTECRWHGTLSIHVIVQLEKKRGVTHPWALMLLFLCEKRMCYLKILGREMSFWESKIHADDDPWTLCKCNHPMFTSRFTTEVSCAPAGAKPMQVCNTATTASLLGHMGRAPNATKAHLRALRMLLLEPHMPVQPPCRSMWHLNNQTLIACVSGSQYPTFTHRVHIALL